VRLTTKYSDARGQQVGLFSAVPAGHGSGAGLPVCLILHGASATTADFRKFGFARFLTAAISAGIPPFVLVGADGGRSYWEGDGKTDEPQRMLTEELPRWCTDQNFDTTRMAAYGWSMGGHGALLWAAGKPNQTAARCLLA
jgi:S-formylglutathione hydrolase FrmB